MEGFRTIYVVDDDQDDIDLFREALAIVAPGIECFTFLDASEVLRALADAMVLPDVIILDLNMPRVSGRQCLADIRAMEELKDIPVIIYSTSSYEKDVKETLDMGANHFFTKPSSFNELCRILSGILAEGERAQR